jgi:hypothetical protein
VSQGFSKQEAFDTAVGRVADRVVNGGDMKERILWAYDTSPDLVSRIVKSSLLSKQPWTPSDIQSAAVLAERVCYVRQSAQGQDCALRIDEVSPARWHGLGRQLTWSAPAAHPGGGAEVPGRHVSATSRRRTRAS